MNQRERTNDPASQPASAGGPSGASLDAIRLAGAAMLAAADEATNAILSGNSQAFNAAVKQEGGQ